MRSLIAALMLSSCAALRAQDGSLDLSFDPGSGFNGPVTCTAVQPDGKIIVSGGFSTYNGTARNFIARLNADGSLDTSFDPGSGANDAVNTISVQGDGDIIIAGYFTSYNGTARNRIARLNSDGSLDTAFNPGSGPGNIVQCSVIQPNGRILIGGYFTTYNGTARGHIARLFADGSLDASFNPGTGANEAVYCLALQSDGRIILGGNFTSYNGTSQNYLARLNSNGTLDVSFMPGTGPNNLVYSTTVQPDGRILIGGAFSSYNGTTRFYLARLYAGGGLDESLTSGVQLNTKVDQVLVRPDGRIVICGTFTSYTGVQRNRIAGLNANGSLDPLFDPGSGGSAQINAMALQPDGKVVIGGVFTSYNGTSRNRIARVHGTPQLGIKLILQGPYTNGAMSDALRSLPSFPATEPFTAMGYTNATYVPGASIGAGVLGVSGYTAIVDWVIVEMRPTAAPATIAASRAALLRRDGFVVDLDGTGAISFPGLASGNYCVAVRSRNHLPVMLATAAAVNYNGALPLVDFTLPSTSVYDADARQEIGAMLICAGDVTFNSTVQYTGSGNDRDPILTRVGSTTPNNTASGYWREDVNMDGVVKYTGSANDRDIILTNVGSTTPNNTRVAMLP